MPHPDSPSTERDRLIGVMDAYLAALAGKDPARLRLAPDFRSTEDTQRLPLGSGVWRTLRGREPGGQYFVDEETGQVEWWGVVEEMGRTAMLSVRLGVRGQAIGEAETIVTRKGAFFDPPAILVDASATFHRVLPESERSPREALIRAADLYFDGIELGDGARIPVRDDCRRLVNGVVDSLDDPATVDPAERHRALPVARQITEGHYRYIEALRARRYPIVDVGRGVVVCHLVFDHPGDLARPGGDFPIRSPNSMVFTEAFKVVGGVIEEIWALGSSPLPYGAGTGW